MIWGFTVAAEDICETKVILRRLEELTGRKIVRNGVSEVVNGSTMEPTGRACFYLDMDMERKGDEDYVNGDIDRCRSQEDAIESVRVAGDERISDAG